MKNIYIVLIKAHTGLAGIARLITGYEYTHISVCTDKSLDDFLSFSRRRHFLPFDAGFMHEKRDYYAFGNHKNFRAKVFRIQVKNENYLKIKRFFHYCENCKKLEFNLFSMMTMPLLHGFPIKNTFNCMSFTAQTLKLSGAVAMNKPYYRYSIKDIDELLEDHCIFEGNVRRTDSDSYNDYMKKCGFGEYILSGIKLAMKLAVRKMNGDE